MSKFRLGCDSAVTREEALKAADELETVVGEIANGKRKPANVPMEPMAVLVQWARDSAGKES